jgi:ATP-dependent DNA helicase DinG
MKLRKEAQDAGILVVNHHLLFADIESRLQSSGYGDYAVLPPYERLIFDEAHGIEEAATSFFSASITRLRLLKHINGLTFSRGGKRFGVLHKISQLLHDESKVDDILSSIETIKETLALLDEAGLEALGYSYTVRIIPEHAIRFEGLFFAFKKLLSALTTCTTLLHAALDDLDDDMEKTSGAKHAGAENHVWEARMILRRVVDAQAFCKNFLEWQEHPEIVFWLEKNKYVPRGSTTEEAVWYPRFVQTPLEIATKMNEGVFEPVKSIVCVSATLKTAGNFSYWTKRNGVSQAPKERVSCAEFPSPFPYRTNVIFAVPTDAPAPNEHDFQSYIDDAIPQLIEAAGGRTLVLFTSYESLRASWEKTSVALASRYVLLRQGDDDRARLLAGFKKDTTSVLFATDSFWTGVDVPGESLSQVIIVKLPFSVPTDPVTQARSEALEKEGKNPFMELSVPDALIKFRQGIGRLIRHSDDKGAIVVLDKRIIQKFYGKLFLESVPETKQCIAPLDEVTRQIADFLV